MTYKELRLYDIKKTTPLVATEIEVTVFYSIHNNFLPRETYELSCAP